MAVSGGSSSGIGGAIKAGRAYVEMGIDSSGVGPALEKVKKTVLNVAKNVAIGGAAVGGIGAGLFAPIFALFEHAVKHITEVRKASEQLDTTTEIFSGLGFAAKKVGVDSEGLVLAGRHMQMFLSSAAKDGGQAAEMLAKLGINAKDIVDQPLDKQFEAIADGLARLPTEGERADAATKILGRSGRNLLPILRQGGQGLRDMADQAREFGLTVSTESAAKAKLWTKAIGQLGMAFEGLKLAVGEALLEIAEPAKQWSDMIVGFVKQGREWVEQNGSLILGIAGVGAALIAAGAALGLFAGGITAATFAVTALATAATAVGAVLGVVFSPVGLGIATIGVASLMLVALADDLGILEQAVNTLTPVWEGLLATFETTWQGIKDAVQSGDLKLAFQVALAGVDVVWKAFLVGLQATWNEIKGAFIDGWLEMIAALKVSIIDLTRFLADTLPARLRDQLGLVVGDSADVMRDFKADRAARQAARANDLNDTVQALIDAKKNLGDLAEQARKQNEGPIRDFRPKLFGAQAAAVDLAGVRGQFGGAGLQSLAIGDQSIQKKQLDALEDIDGKLGDIKGNIGGLKVE